MMSIIAIILLYLINSEVSCEIKLYPDSFRCVSLVWYNGVQYGIDEFVDRLGLQSSTMKKDIKFGYSSTIYNRIQEDGGNFTRQFVQVNKFAECESRKFDHWILSHLRGIHFKMLPKEKLTSAQLEVAIGPSTILLAIEKSLHQFSYVKTEFDTSFMSYIDTYKYVIDSITRSGFEESRQKLLIKVQVASSSHDERQPIETLEELSSKTMPNLDKRLEILAVEICRIMKVDLEKKKKEEGYSCTSKEIVFSIQYLRMIGMVPDPLGIELSQNGESDFEKAPFLLPIGVGCFQDAKDIGNKYLIAPRLLFSAQFKTSNGSLGLSYVAYDGKRNILRLDRDGRKSIYDLNKDLSYHIYNSIESVNAIIPGFAKCISSTIDPTYIQASFMLERLLGFSTLDNSKPARHLGNRVIDYVPYEVYEIELEWDSKRLEGYNLPILVESTRFALPKTDAYNSNRYRFMITYYVQELHSTTDAQTIGRPLQIIKFMELRRLRQDSANWGTTLFNRLEFVDFSWSLDIRPDEDSELEDTDKIFNLHSCEEDRSKEVALSFEVSPVSRVERSEQEAKVSIKELLNEAISNKLEISPLNIAFIEVASMKSSAHLRCKSRIVDLLTTKSDNYFLGYSKYWAAMRVLSKTILHANTNRHSIADCKLDSLAINERNYLMYCPGLTLCILFSQTSYTEYKDKLLTDIDQTLLMDSDEKETACEFHRVSNLQDLSPDEQDSSVTVSIMERLYRLKGSLIQLTLERSIDGGKTEVAFYEGRIGQPEVEYMTPQGMTELRSPPLNLRYTTVKEEPEVRNMNYAVKLANKEMRMQQCQSACQLDDLCESFSLCLRQKGAIQENDCILSTLRPIGEQMDGILESERNSVDSFDVKVSSQVISQVFRFRHDAECRLHPKLHLELFQVVEVIKNITIPPELNRETKKMTQTLEDCAISAHDTSLQLATESSSTFTYCPITSRCFLYNQAPTGLSQPQNCYVYEQTHLQFYDSKPFSRVIISQEASSPLNDGQKLEKLGLGRWIEGISINQCAKECSLRHSGCLDFDYCKPNHNDNVCILYKIRSPLQLATVKEFLPQEIDIYSKTLNHEEHAAHIIEEENCSHFDLKLAYLRIRLGLLFTQYENAKRAKIAEAEDFINSLIEKRNNRTIGPLKHLESGNSSTLLFSLLFGLLLGYVGVVYYSKISDGAVNLYAQLGARRGARDADHLVFPENMNLRPIEHPSND